LPIRRITSGVFAVKPYLHCCELEKSFDGQAVLKGISLNVARGECLVLLGPSGCGKSTLLNIISGSLTADKGELAVDGVLLDQPSSGLHVPMRKRQFAMVFQEFSLWPHMSVAENVGFGLKIQGLSRVERSQKTKEALNRVRMGDFAERMPGQLSGGQQQRVAIARALVVQPRILLLDEPLSALDARLREDLKEEISDLLKTSGITSIYVTHDQSEAFSVGDQIAVLNQGKIEQLGVPEKLYKEPASRFVASFVGSGNLIPFESEAGQVNLSPLIKWPSGKLEIPRKGHVMLRRETVDIEPANGHLPVQEFPWVVLQGHCRQKQYLGDRNEVIAELADGSCIRGYSHRPIEKGAKVIVRFSLENAQFFEE